MTIYTLNIHAFSTGGDTHAFSTIYEYTDAPPYCILHTYIHTHFLHSRNIDEDPLSNSLKSFANNNS